MGNHVKEMRQCLLQAKPIDLSKRPVILKLPQREHYTLAFLTLPFLVWLTFEFFQDWNQGKFSYEYLLLAGMNLYWGFSQLKHVLSQYQITFGEDEVSFTKKRLFVTVENWKTPLSQYQALELNYIAGEQKAPSFYSVDLIHPDSNKSIPLAASLREVIARGWTDQFKIYLSLPVVDKAASSQKFSRAEKDSTRTWEIMKKAPIPVLILGMTAIPLGYLSWAWMTSPMKSIPCTVMKHQVQNVEPIPPEGPQKNLKIYYQYRYGGQEYMSPSNIGDFKNEAKMRQWMNKSPVGSEPGCWVDSRDPKDIMKVPLPKYLMYGSILVDMGVMVFAGMWLLGVLFPLGFTKNPRTIFERITQSRVKNKIKKRYRSSILELKKLGFQGYAFYSEITNAFSLISMFRTFLAMCFKKEVLSIRHPLRIATSYPLLALPEQGTYAVAYALETKFLTLFTDGTALVTGTEGRIPTFVDETAKLHRQGTTQTVAAAWQQHQDRVGVFKKEGKEEKSDTRFEDYAEILTRTEKVYLDNNLFQGS